MSVVDEYKQQVLQLRALLKQAEALVTSIDELVTNVTNAAGQTKVPQQHNADNRYVVTLVSSQHMSIAEFCGSPGFIDECRQLNVSPTFVDFYEPASGGPCNLRHVAICKLYDVHVTSSWLASHKGKADDEYYIGKVEFYIESPILYIGGPK